MSARSPELKARKGSASATLGCLLRPPSRLRSISAHLIKYKVMIGTSCHLLLKDLVKIRSDQSCLISSHRSAKAISGLEQWAGGRLVTEEVLVSVNSASLTWDNTGL